MAKYVGQLGEFGDARRASVGDRLIERVVETGSLVIRTLGGDRAGEIAIHRFLSAPSVSCKEMVKTLSSNTASACAGRRILAVQDTTEINFSGREANRQGLGPAGNGVAAGFFMHPVVAVDADSEAVLGLVDVQIWTRDKEVDKAARRNRTLEDKESFRWLTGAERASEILTDANSVVMVADRECDIFSSFARRPANVDMIVRAAHDRVLHNGGFLFASPTSWTELGRMRVVVTPRRTGEPGRTATVALRAGVVEINRPRRGFSRGDPRMVSLTLVEAREIGVPVKGEPLLWRLLTTINVSTAAEAEEIVRLYRLRWRIEEIFRSLKRDGMQLEETQLHHADRIFKLAMVGLEAATRTIQLVDARGGSQRPASDVINSALLPAAEAIGKSLEGGTLRQKNPHPPQSLAWLSWIVARLGGWNCYYKPPGPKTMRAGWSRFSMMAVGFAMAN